MINFSQPSITNEDIKSVNDVLKSGWLTTGKKTMEFQNSISHYIGSKYCLCLSSCTAALHLALVCAGVKEGDEVITTPFTFASTIGTILYLKAKPVFVDIKPSDFIIDENQVEKKITKKTRAILPVHYAGFSADLDSLRNLSRKYGLKLIEDAAHAFGSKYKNEFIGSKSEFCCFSFYPTKNITTIEGGALVTDNKKVFKRATCLALHGVKKDAWKRYSKEGTWRYDISELGYKYNMPDISSALGLSQLKRIQTFKIHREKIYQIYKSGLSGLEEIEILDGNPNSNPFRHLLVIKIKSGRISKNLFITKLKKNNIIASVHFIPVYKFSAYRKLFHVNPRDFPITQKADHECVSLPFSSVMTEKEAMYVVQVIKRIFTS